MEKSTRIYDKEVRKEGIMKIWSFKLHEDEWLEARLRAKTQHQKFIEWMKSANSKSFIG